MGRRTGHGVAIMTAVLALAGAPVRADETARDLVKRATDSAPQVPIFARANLSSSRGWRRQFEASHKKLPDQSYAVYIEFIAPQDVRDTRFLAFDRADGRDQQFMWVPAVGRVIEINNEARKQPFLGSDFYVSDMAAAPIDDFTYSFAGEAEVGGRHCKLIEIVPKNAAAWPYSKTIAAIDPIDLVTMRTEFFDAKGQPLKVWTIEKLEKVDGIWTPLVQVMKNLQQQTDSRIETTEIKYNADVPDDVFTRRNLTR